MPTYNAQHSSVGDAQSESSQRPNQPVTSDQTTFSIARGRVDTWNRIDLQEEVTPAKLGDYLRQAQRELFDHTFEEISKLRAAKAAGDAYAARKLATLKRAPWFVCSTFKADQRKKTNIVACTAFVGDADQPGAERKSLLAALAA